MKPAAIVEWRPTPGVIRHPIPAAIGIDPAPAIEIGPPTVIAYDGCGLPATTRTLDIDPVSIRRQSVVIIGVIGRRWFWFRRRSVTVGGVIRRRCGFGEFGSWRIWLGHRIGRVRRGIGRERLGFGWSQSEVCRSPLNEMIALEHCCDHGGRNSDVIEVNDFLGAKIEGAKGVGDERKHDALIDPGVGELDDFSRGGSWFQVCGNLDFSGEFFGRRGGDGLIVGCRESFFGI